ncbi:MAG: YwmB family TATA-box binding protein [Bacteroidota bacterium]
MIRSFLVKMLISAGFLMIFSTKFVDVTIGERLYEYPLETAWKATGIPLREVNTESWLKLNDSRLSLSQLKRFAEDIQKKLNLRLKTKMLAGEEEYFSFVSFEGTQPNGTNVSITIQSTRIDGVSETQMGIYTIHSGEMKNLRQYIQNLRGIIISLGSDLDFNVVFIGERPGKIPPTLVRELSGRAFRKINAELIDSAFEDDNSYQTGFSRLIKESVEIDTRRINVEFDTRYDRIRNVTQIILATPRATDGV